VVVADCDVFLLHAHHDPIGVSEFRKNLHGETALSRLCSTRDGEPRLRWPRKSTTTLRTWTTRDGTVDPCDDFLPLLHELPLGQQAICRALVEDSRIGNQLSSSLIPSRNLETCRGIQIYSVAALSTPPCRSAIGVEPPERDLDVAILAEWFGPYI
jgi:hypothetical protein